MKFFKCFTYLPVTKIVQFRSICRLYKLNIAQIPTFMFERLQNCLLIGPYFLPNLEEEGWGYTGSPLSILPSSNHSSYPRETSFGTSSKGPAPPGWLTGERVRLVTYWL